MDGKTVREIGNDLGIGKSVVSAIRQSIEKILNGLTDGKTAREPGDPEVISGIRQRILEKVKGRCY